ncbi:MAG: heavy-metal-associated domain-containing protein [cyanobacterium endosymbiont of Rhopalodia musculus]|uniref:heavy-metal-associated domain-containing protein n=1 Tax=cyanobacterium endosymbiont of Epithemia clementina EcSB TaxID=3034674 RepID=UPI00248124F4|nr:heavy-metal-associated domain-containing protein [cyanobacterium endosymbiont of Epithemia clementina EcSB]WGT67318.1 heavy-metal-associated domain-containing protein [cyanobacterium endosymbiont of Epithemia clementina EcSB]
MSITFKVPSIACEACAKTITKAVQSEKPETAISIDVSTKIVTVETTVSEETIRKIIEGTGHTVED